MSVVLQNFWSIMLISQSSVGRHFHKQCNSFNLAQAAWALSVAITSTELAILSSSWKSLVVYGYEQYCAYQELHSECRGGIATAPPLRRSYSDRAVTSPGGAFQTDTSLANHRHRTRLLADCQWRCRWRCGLGRLRNTRSLTETIPRDRRKLIKLMLRKWTFLPPRSHLIRQFVKRHLVTLRREQHVLAQWLRQYFCQDHGVRSVTKSALH